MVDWSAKLGLPYMAAAQAQKHVTHNDALQLLDAITQLGVVAFDAVTPPALLVDGMVYAVGTGASDAWAGQDGKLALVANGGWQFLSPQPGWRASLGTALRIWNGNAWVAPDLPELQNLAGAGIGTSYSADNPLAVAGAATLLTHAGAGHQVKVNKANAGDTAAVLFQTGWSGRAELGTAGQDDFALKVSTDGSAWTTALTVPGASGNVRFGGAIEAKSGTATAPGIGFDGDSDTGIYRTGANSLGLATGGAQRALINASGINVSGLISGSAVQSSATDLTAGRLMPVGAFGLGAQYPVVLPNIDDSELPNGFYMFNMGGATAGTAPAFSTGALIIASGIGAGAKAPFQIALERSSGLGRMAIRSCQAAVFGPWQTLGNAAERGSNGNGDYVRFADGTQICSRTMPASSSAAATWTFPASFSAAPQISGTVTATVLSALCLDAATTTTAASFSARSKTDLRRADSCSLVATGRWF